MANSYNKNHTQNERIYDHICNLIFDVSNQVINIEELNN